MAPARVVRFQKSEHSTTGVKAAAIPDQAKRTNQKIIRVRDSARAMPTRPITTVTALPRSESRR